MLHIIILLLILIFLFKSNETFDNSSSNIILNENINEYSTCHLFDDKEGAQGKIVTFDLGNGLVKTTCDFGEPIDNKCSTISTKCANKGDCSEYIELETTINGEQRCRKFPHSDPFTTD